MTIKELLQEIFALTLLGNEQKKHHFFLDLSAHTSAINIRIFVGGWKEHSAPTLSMSCYYDWEGAQERLTEIRNILSKYID